jgi:hypothetical protein
MPAYPSHLTSTLALHIIDAFTGGVLHADMLTNAINVDSVHKWVSASACVRNNKYEPGNCIFSHISGHVLARIE